MKFSPMGIALLGVIAYLSYHAISGDQGLSSWSHLQDEIRSLEEDRNILLEKKERLNLQIARLSGDFIDDDFLVYMGYYDTVTEDFTTILNNLSDISATETWWGNADFRKIYEKEYMLNVSNNDGVFNSDEFFASLKTNTDLDDALGPDVKRSQFNRAVDYRLDGSAYDESLEVKIGTVTVPQESTKWVRKPGVELDCIVLDTGTELVKKYQLEVFD